jgi:hypothetical protein
MAKGIRKEESKTVLHARFAARIRREAAAHGIDFNENLTLLFIVPPPARIEAFYCATKL